MSAKFNYGQIQGVKGNIFVTEDFIFAVETMAERLETKPEYVLAAMSFETGGTFNPATENPIGATGLIQFLKATAKILGTTTNKLKSMTAVEQLKYVEKFFSPFAGKLSSLEAVYTTILSGSPKKSDAVLFKVGTPEYKLNPLDWNNDGEITAREAATIVSARLFGGVKTVQQRLLDIGIVPADLQTGFADGKWGINTSRVLAKFQKSRGLAATGLMDEAAGFALFPNTLNKTKTIVLKNGSRGELVKKLQDSLVTLGYLKMENIGGSFGTFGRQTQTAVEILQKHLGILVTGKFSAIEQKAIDSIKAGIAKGNPNSQLIKVIQNRLVKLKFMTQAEVDSGYGIFGLQTEAAVKKFQRANGLQESGIVEAVSFKNLFNRILPDKTAESDSFPAKDGEHYSVVSGILMIENLQAKTAEVADNYFAITGSKLIVTSGYRPPDRQASAIYNKLVIEGEAKVRSLYKNKSAIDEVLTAFRANKGNPAVAVEAMRKVIENQITRQPPVFISNHLLGNAIDIRKLATNFNSLKKAVNQAGGRLIVEGDHYHVELD
ncbi:MAG: peptidoglycan-binding protein [Acidobacteria bacterium]|nr:peptidoglycan-binding protein [Acidobacteriota bacterium]